MTGKEAIRTALTSTQQLTTMYLADLADADFLVRPVPGANHIAWQLGHLIHGEQQLVSVLGNTAFPELPADFAEKHSSASAPVDPPQGFRTKAEYLDLFNKTRQATLAALDHLTDTDLDKPTAGPMAKWAPSFGALLILTANHTLMHAGQFTVLRRKLGKPVLF